VVKILSVRLWCLAPFPEHQTRPGTLPKTSGKYRAPAPRHPFPEHSSQAPFPRAPAPRYPFPEHSSQAPFPRHQASASIRLRHPSQGIRRSKIYCQVPFPRAFVSGTLPKASGVAKFTAQHPFPRHQVHRQAFASRHLSQGIRQAQSIRASAPFPEHQAWPSTLPKTSGVAKFAARHPSQSIRQAQSIRAPAPFPRAPFPKASGVAKFTARYPFPGHSSQAPFPRHQASAKHSRPGTPSQDIRQALAFAPRQPFPRHPEHRRAFAPRHSSPGVRQAQSIRAPAPFPKASGKRKAFAPRHSSQGTLP
jgi:hypothetical protein